jgi:glutathione synthase/RimK-type ligase-like ATP-grasp enzyme
MPHIALATCYEHANLFEDETPLVAVLEKRGIKVTPAVWNSPEIAWDAYDFIVIRNIWDYHRQPQTFVAWLDYLEAKNLRVCNPLPLLRWNLNKIYLQTISQLAYRIHPTEFLANSSLNLVQALSEKGWHDAVIKPLISASGENTWRIKLEEAAAYQDRFDFIQKHFGAMIQPYAQQIATEGEYSLVFFNGEFSHAVLKRPAPNTLFVHEEHGGSTIPIAVSSETIEQTKAIIDLAQQITGTLPLYARVDGYLDSGKFVLMELECIEPELYMLYDDGAGERFAEAIIATQ